MQPDELASDKINIINETITYILAGKHPYKIISSYSTLDTYDETPNFIPVYITEDVAELVMRNIFRSSVPGGKDSEALQG